jgi:alkylhydroperoxidase family enzyme
MSSVEELRAIAGSIEPDPRMAAYLARVRTRAYAITDAEVQALRDAGISEDEVFEQTVAAAISEGLRRWDAAERAIG